MRRLETSRAGLFGHALIAQMPYAGLSAAGD